MISTNTRSYDYYLYGDNDGYGQPQLSTDVVGTVKMSVYAISKTVQNGVQYTNEDYIGLTYDQNIDDTYVIQYGTEKLKVLYTIKCPNVKTQVFMARM